MMESEVSLLLNATTASTPPLLFYSLQATVAYTICLLPMIIVGLSSHLLLFAVLVKDARFHTTTYAQIASLAVSDLGVMVVAPPFMLDNVLSMFSAGGAAPHSVTGTTSCTALGFVVDLMVTAVGFNMVLLAINRQVCIVKPYWYPLIFTKKLTCLYISIPWLLSLSLILPTQIHTVARISYDPVYNVCKYDEHYNDTYTLVLNLRSFVVPPILILCYGSILVKVRRSKRSIDMSSSGVTKDELNLLIQFLIIVSVYVGAWIFYMILTILATQYQIYLEHAGLYVNNLVALNSSINPLVYFTFNRQLRASARDMLVCRTPLLHTLLPSRNRDGAAGSSSSGSTSNRVV